MKSSNDRDQEERDPAGTGSNPGALVELQLALIVDAVHRMLGARVAMLEGTVFALNLRLSKAEATLADALFSIRGHTFPVVEVHEESGTQNVATVGPADVAPQPGAGPVT